jgi:hypothetical protein
MNSLKAYVVSNRIIMLTAGIGLLVASDAALAYPILATASPTASPRAQRRQTTPRRRSSNRDRARSLSMGSALHSAPLPPLQQGEHSCSHVS